MKKEGEGEEKKSGKWEREGKVYLKGMKLPAAAALLPEITSCSGPVAELKKRQ